VENWGVSAGVPASEVDVGFKVDVWPYYEPRRTAIRHPIAG
jgi:hypothetical protein